MGLIRGQQRNVCFCMISFIYIFFSSFFGVQFLKLLVGPGFFLMYHDFYIGDDTTCILFLTLFISVSPLVIQVCEQIT